MLGAQVATKMGALQNEQRVLRAAVEAELANARSSCAATLESAQVGRGSSLLLHAGQPV